MASLRWDGGANIILIKEKAQTIELVAKGNKKKIPLTALKSGLAFEGFRRGDDKFLTLLLYDSHRAGINNIRSFKVFDYDPAFKVPAQFKPAVKPMTVTIPTTRGESKRWTQVGVLTFKVGGQEELLKVYDDGKSGNELFLMFKDATNGISTYRGGRFLNVEIEKKVNELKEEDDITLDFNFAENPMCARSSAFMWDSSVALAHLPGLESSTQTPWPTSVLEDTKLIFKSGKYGHVEP